MAIILAASVLGAGLQFFVKLPAAPAPRPPTYRKDLPPNTRRVVATKNQSVAELLAQSNVDPFTVGWIESSGPVFYPGNPSGTFARIHWDKQLTPGIFNELFVHRGDELALMDVENASPTIYRGSESDDLVFCLRTLDSFVPPVERVLSAIHYWGLDQSTSVTRVAVLDAKAWIRAAVEAQNGWEPWYEFERIYVSTLEQMPVTSTSRIIGAVVGGNLIHVRVFDSDGRRVFDADEAKLRSVGRNYDVEALKEILMEKDESSDSFDPYTARHLIAALSGPQCLIWSVSPSPYPGAEAELHQTQHRKWEKDSRSMQFFASPDNQTVTIIDHADDL